LACFTFSPLPSVLQVVYQQAPQQPNVVVVQQPAYPQHHVVHHGGYRGGYYGGGYGGGDLAMGFVGGMIMGEVMDEVFD